MKSQRKNKIIKITNDILCTLELVKNKIFSNYNKLMNQDEADSAIKKGYFNGEAMPNPFVFFVDEKEAKELKNGDEAVLICEENEVGYIKISSVFKSKNEYKSSVFARGEIKEWAISGEFEILSNEIKNTLDELERIKTELNAKKITAVMLTADPLHRAHERLIRMTIDKADLVVIFLLQTHGNEHLSFNLRKKSLEIFAKKYLPPNKITIFPFKSSIFKAHQNPALECITAHNIGANKLVLGQNHAGIGMFFDHNQPKTMLDRYINDLGMEIIVLPELVYCNECKTIVSTRTCPHGQHHHIKYHPPTIKTLLFNGIMPPAILMRSEISALILSELFKDRFSDVQKLCDALFPNSGLLEERNERDFYKELMKLYQTTSLS